MLARTFEITQSSASDVRLLISEKFRFASLEKDSNGMILRIPKPVKTKKGFVLHGIIFPNNQLGRALSIRMIMSSVEHLSVHAMISNFSIYDKWVKGKDPKLAAFAIDLIEDLCVKYYVRSSLRGLLEDFALANAISYVAITKAEKIGSKQILVQSALLSYIIASNYRYFLPSDVKNDVFYILSELYRFEKFLSQSTLERFWCSDDVVTMKMELAGSIYRRLEKYGSPKKVLSLPYTDSHGIESFNGELVLSIAESMEALPHTSRMLGLETTNRTVDELLSSPTIHEASNTLYDIVMEQHWKDRLVQRYMNIAKNTEFDDFVFPIEDYAMYYRSYRKYVGAIRKMVDQIRMLKNDLDMNPNQEIGQVDINEVVQAMAAKKMNANVFTKDDFLSKDEAWCILLDMSGSLSPFASNTREIALCLAEMAKELMRGSGSWGLYAFSNRFTIVKDMEEEYSTNVKARIGGLGKGGLSYMPDALQLGAQIVAKSAKEHNYIFIISDGLPSGYPGIEEKLEKTIKSILSTGTTLIPVGVGSNAFKRYMRNASLVADTPLDLASKFVKIYFEFSV